ncbi:hypothetical protein Neosp_015260 [[Neocosmospora] mangrovei]
MALAAGGRYVLETEAHTVNHDLERHICVAYEALFQLEPKYHISPPNFYQLLRVPPLPPAVFGDIDNDSAQTARLRTVMARLDGKMRKLFLERRALPKGPGRVKVIKAITAWNKIGSVLLHPVARELYEQEFWGNNVGEVLMKMCGERWEKKR